MRLSITWRAIEQFNRSASVLDRTKLATADRSFNRVGLLTEAVSAISHHRRPDLLGDQDYALVMSVFGLVHLMGARRNIAPDEAATRVIEISSAGKSGLGHFAAQLPVHAKLLVYATVRETVEQALVCRLVTVRIPSRDYEDIV